VAVGTDSLILRELLHYGGSLAKRSTIHSTTIDLYGTARKEGSSCFIDGTPPIGFVCLFFSYITCCLGGALPLAKGGVCLLGSLGIMKKDVRVKLDRSKLFPYFCQEKTLSLCRSGEWLYVCWHSQEVWGI